jgi:hypothetical protein
MARSAERSRDVAFVDIYMWKVKSEEGESPRYRYGRYVFRI